MDSVEVLEIVRPGPLTTVQDAGRYGFGRYGVAPSGAVDSFSMRAANLLVGNPEGEAVLEITLAGLKTRALRELVLAVTGGDLKPHLNGRPLESWKSHLLRPGDLLSFEGLQSGCRAYLSLGGGIAADPVLGSRSTNLASHFGGYLGRALQGGDRILSASPHLSLATPGRSLREDWIPRYGRNAVARVLPGPQREDFPVDAWRRFLNSEFTVTSLSDRTGIRLAGPCIRHREELRESIISEGVVAGAVQVPGDGQPIVILVETVTGGYRKIAAVISADLPLLGQLRPGDRMRFQEVTLEDALAALRRSEEVLDSLRRSACTGQV